MLQASYQRILEVWNPILWFTAYWAWDLKVNIQTMECIHVFCDVCPTDLAAYFLSLQPLLKLSNSTHNVVLGVKTLNCLLPLTSCVNSWHGLAPTHGIVKFSCIDIDGVLSLLVVHLCSGLVDYFVYLFPACWSGAFPLSVDCILYLCFWLYWRFLIIDGLQFRQPSPGIQNVGMAGSINTSQMRPGAISGPQQPRPGLPSSTTPIPSGSQMPGSQVRKTCL